MSSFNKSTVRENNYKIRVVTLDSKTAFVGTVTDEDCSWKNYLAEPLILKGTTEIYLESIYIGGYKINETTSSTVDKRLAWNVSDPPAADGGNIYYFCIGIPEFEIKSGVAEYRANPDASDMTGHMNKRFCLCQEPALVGDISGSVLPINESKPFILGHLSKTSVFVSKIEPKTINSININIQDQDGRSIWTEGGASAQGNPNGFLRRIFMQFIFVEKK